MSKAVLCIGTKRGLFTATSDDRRSWTLEPASVSHERVYNAVLDTRSAAPRMFACVNGDIYGCSTPFSDDFGKTWTEPSRSIRFAETDGRTVVNLWIVEPGRADDPDTLYAGIDPASLWVTHDRGDTWDEVTGLTDHPTRDRWEEGNGGLCLHSIVPDHADANRMWVGISAVGVMETTDGGRSWDFRNANTRARHMPELYPEFGQCVHRVVQHPSQADVLFQQNHWGVYATESGGKEWRDVGESLPSEFGFPMAMDPHHPETLFVIVEGEGRHNIGEQLTVWRTSDAGKSWATLTNGLPSGPSVRLGVLRHGMCTDRNDPCGVYVGTNTGQLFASMDRGEEWSLIADFLPSIYSVTAAITRRAHRLSSV